MNDRLKPGPAARCAELQATEIRRCLKRLLSSPEFAKAPRMSKLLSFLVENKLDGREHISEYEIGLEVFRRDASLYDTTLDPVVRVQVGRLRSRLATYHAALASPPEVQISIPLGSYVPVISQSVVARPSLRYKLLQVAPLRNLTDEDGSSAFVSGLDEELGSSLFRAFGNAIELHATRAGGQSGGEPPHRLEGSIRVEDKHVRASMRLVDMDAGQIAWLSKFDLRGKLCMSLQEKLASAICAELERHLFSHSG